jgi:hemerythrin
MAIRWTPLLAVGVPCMDSEHLVLFALANRVFEALGADDRVEVSRLLLELEAFATEHFAAEEAFMAAAGYGGLDEHHAAHAALRFELAGLLRERDGSCAVTVLHPRTSHFLFDWLLGHISHEDRAFGSWYARRDTRPGQQRLGA